LKSCYQLILDVRTSAHRHPAIPGRETPDVIFCLQIIQEGWSDKQ